MGGGTETLQPRGHPLPSIQFLCGMCLKIQMCVYSQDEQPTGLFGESQQDEQTNYEVKEQQQHIRQPPTTHTHILLCVNYNINPCLTATWPKFYLKSNQHFSNMGYPSIHPPISTHLYIHVPTSVYLYINLSSFHPSIHRFTPYLSTHDPPIYFLSIYIPFYMSVHIHHHLSSIHTCIQAT